MHEKHALDLNGQMSLPIHDCDHVNVGRFERSMDNYVSTACLSRSVCVVGFRSAACEFICLHLMASDLRISRFRYFYGIRFRDVGYFITLAGFRFRDFNIHGFDGLRLRDFGITDAWYLMASDLNASESGHRQHS